MSVLVRNLRRLRQNSKDVAIRRAKRDGRKVVWKDEEGRWHDATDRRNTPLWATETEDVQ